MTSEKLIRRLSEMYEGAPLRDSTTMIRIFGIIYSDEIESCGISKKEIARKSLGKEGYHAEISKGIRLAKYVQLKPGVTLP